MNHDNELVVLPVSSHLKPSHIIYLMPGKKTGCTTNLKRRRNEYRVKLGYAPIIRILEELVGTSNQEAGDKEWQWADRLGYKRGIHYTQTMKAAASVNAYPNQSPESRIEFGRLGARTGGMSKQAKCPHCGLVSGLPILSRWHLDRCRHRLRGPPNQ